MSDKKLLVVDAGHGMGNRRYGVFDPGAVFQQPGNPKDSITESEIVWDWYLTMKHIANSDDESRIKVVGTRDGFMTPLPLNSRPFTARKLGADFFLSIHVNAGGGEGCEVFYRHDKSKAFAQTVLECCQKATSFKDRGVKKKGLAALSGGYRGFDGPSALLEIGFGDYEPDLEVILLKEVRVEFARNLIGKLAAND